jgi:ADP-heptose:LPS heptosyltransferase
MDGILRQVRQPALIAIPAAAQLPRRRLTMVSTDESTADRVLVIFPGALGDLICVLPALRALARRHQGCSFELMARAELADFAVGRIGVHRAHSIDRREVGLLFNPGSDAPERAAEFFGAFKAIHSFFGMDHVSVREVLTRGCPGTVSFYPFRPEAGGHTSSAYLQAVAACGGGANIEPEFAGLELRNDDLAEARKITAGHGAEPGRYVLLMPGSGSPAKNWPIEYFRQLAGHLGRSIAVLTVLGPAEDGLEGVFSGLPIIRNPPLGALAGLARMSSVFVGNDSGVSHLAAAAGGRGVVIFGPTEPARWRPMGAVNVLRRMPLRELSWQEVASAIKAIKGVRNDGVNFDRVEPSNLADSATK